MNPPPLNLNHTHNLNHNLNLDPDLPGDPAIQIQSKIKSFFQNCSSEREFALTSRMFEPTYVGCYEVLKEPLKKEIKKEIKPELRSRIGERTPPACESGRRARTFVKQTIQAGRRKIVCGTMFSAGRRKPHARGVCSPDTARRITFNFVVRVKNGLFPRAA
jgi:hypothetical protein